MKDEGNARSQIRVLCVDDHPLVREGIGSVICNEPGMLLIAEASSGREAIEAFRLHRPDITLMDLRLPDINGIDAMIAIRTEFPNARVIILTTFEGDAEIQRALQAGAQGYMLKSVARKQLLDVIRKVHGGKMHIPPEVAMYLAEHMGEESLSKREVEVLQKLAAGKRNSEIAALLFISDETVKGHVKHIMDKLGASDRTEAVAIGVRRGIIHL
ncbi:MAG TPA: response regulator transcription factor [Acidobacteriaceae bacterium]|jgi:DNA-binding NarL/FixJ family response regulator|nr:response regulator transcription factor [Acidobacteriaceae bacterium]